MALLAGCRSEPPAEPERAAARRPPPPACEQARSELQRRERNGDFLFEESGEAMVDRMQWLGLNQSAQNEVITKLAVVGACSVDVPQAEIEVTIRDQSGTVLESEWVIPSTDFRTR
jgi:hypothetical protein